MSFDQRLQRAIARGERTRVVRSRELAEQELSAEERKSLFGKARTDVSDHVENCLKQLADQLPGFEFHSIMGETGWGARINKDELKLQPGRSAANLYSRLEMTVSPLGQAPIVELVAKGTIRNREIFNRKHFQQLSHLEIDAFRELVDLWVLEYAEQSSAAT